MLITKKSWNLIGPEVYLASVNQKRYTLPSFDEYFHAKNLRYHINLQSDWTITHLATIYIYINWPFPVILLIKEYCNLTGQEVHLGTPNKKW